MIFKSKIKWAALGGLILSFISLLVHLLLAKYSSADLVQYSALADFTDDLNLNLQGMQGSGHKKLWENVRTLDTLQPYANPRSEYLVPAEQNNGFIYAKVFGEFEKIRTAICDLVAISRLLNATLVIPEIQATALSKGISPKFKGFSYLYNEDQFISGLTNDVNIVRTLPSQFTKARKNKQFPMFKPKDSASPNFYISEVLPKLKKAKVVGFMIKGGSCLEAILPPSMAEYQRLRCRVAFHALQFRPEILGLGQLIVKRLRVSGQHYLAFHPGLVRDTLAYHGCAEIFQDVHSELIQYRRAQMIKEKTPKEELNIDSHVRKANGSCPLMPEEVGLLLRAMGYPPNTRIYLAGSEIFGGQRVLIPLRAMFTNLVDRTSLCSKRELMNVVGPEAEVPETHFQVPPAKSEEELKKEWAKAGPRPRPLPPPPERPIYQHEKEGWYGWVSEKESEPEPSLLDFRMEAHRLLWSAVDYIVSLEADAFFPGFSNEDSGPDFAGMVMGHRLYEMASARTYRPDRKYLMELFNSTKDNLHHPKHNWTMLVRAHLNKSLDHEGIRREFLLSKPKSFLSLPILECSCTIAKTKEVPFEGIQKCPNWMENDLLSKILHSSSSNEDNEVEEDNTDLETQSEPEHHDDDDEDDRTGRNPSLDQDAEMDPDD